MSIETWILVGVVYLIVRPYVEGLIEAHREWPTIEPNRQPMSFSVDATVEIWDRKKKTTRKKQLTAGQIVDLGPYESISKFQEGHK